MRYNEMILELLKKQGLGYEGFTGIGLDFKSLYYSKGKKGAYIMSGANYKEIYLRLLEGVVYGDL